jgi:pyruvate kinase
MNNNNSFRKTKIIATVGPASDSKDMLRQLILAGVDVFRLNFSHGSYEVHKNVISRVRELNEELGTNVCLLQDLQGPKIRTDEVENNGVELVPGEEIIITNQKMLGNSKKVSTTYTSLPQDVQLGDMILIDDGKIELKVKKVDGNEVTCEIIYGGILKSKKGINLPNTNVSAPSLTEKDEKDFVFGMENDVEWVALSFVRSAKDITYLRGLIEKAGKATKIVAKIEKPEAVKNIDEIIAVTDAIMVARGDLGVEIVMEEVPMVQKMIVAKCNQAGKPVIIATQMMESMIENPRPTRAETNDVANAVMDGADTVMLSAETAAGKYPVQTIKSMARTIRCVEQQGAIYHKYYNLDPQGETFINDSLVSSAIHLSKDTKASAIVGMTKSGYTAFRISAHRPKASIYVFTSNRVLLNTLSLVWGVKAFYYDKMVSTDETFEDIEKFLLDKGLIKAGDVVVNTASTPLHWENKTNMLKVNVAK